MDWGILGFYFYMHKNMNTSWKDFEFFFLHDCEMVS